MFTERAAFLSSVLVVLTLPGCSSTSGGSSSGGPDAAAPEAGDGGEGDAGLASDDAGEGTDSSDDAADGSCPRVADCAGGSVWDPSACACVLTDASTVDDAAPTDAGAGGCRTAAECPGALPSLCRSCPDGGSGCAHHVCAAGVCGVAYCE